LTLNITGESHLATDTLNCLLSFLIPGLQRLGCSCTYIRWFCTTVLRTILVRTAKEQVSLWHLVEITT